MHEAKTGWASNKSPNSAARQSLLRQPFNTFVYNVLHRVKASRKHLGVSEHARWFYALSKCSCSECSSRSTHAHKCPLRLESDASAFSAAAGPWARGRHPTPLSRPGRLQQQARNQSRLARRTKRTAHLSPSLGRPALVFLLTNHAITGGIAHLAQQENLG